MRYYFTLLLLLSAMLCGACGMRGPLTLPQKPPPKSATTPAPVPPAIEDKAEGMTTPSNTQQ